MIRKIDIIKKSIFNGKNKNTKINLTTTTTTTNL